MPSWWKDRDGLAELVILSAFGLLISTGLCGLGFAMNQYAGFFSVFGALGLLGSVFGLVVSAVWSITRLLRDAIRGREEDNLSISARPPGRPEKSDDDHAH